MNSKITNFIKNFSYTLISNIVSLFVSILVVLIVPKLIGIQEYGYWQIYLFYSSYIGFLHFGWNDGIYLKYGGLKYKELEKKILFSQFYMLVGLQLIIATIISIVSSFYFTDENRMFIFFMIAWCMVITNIRYMLIFILQCTNRIKDYATIILMSRLLYCFLILIFLISGIREFKILIIADLIGNLVSLAYAMYCCRDIVFQKISNFHFTFKETKDNISIGIKLMFANIANLLIIGVVRFGIERSWDVSTFGKVSLTLSISNFMMIFINAIGVILFPILRRLDGGKLPLYYQSMRDLLMACLLATLVIYYPIKVFLTGWFPKYEDSLIFMGLIFPICVFEGKMALLINTFFKTLRKEKLMLKINLITMAISIVVTVITTIVLNNLNLAVISILFLLIFRCVISEYYLLKIIKVPIQKDLFLDLIMTTIFVLIVWFVNSWNSVLFYGISYLIYLIIKRKDIVNTIRNVKIILRT